MSPQRRYQREPASAVWSRQSPQARVAQAVLGKQEAACELSGTPLIPHQHDRSHRSLRLSGGHLETRARKMHNHLAGPWVLPPDRDMLRRQRDDLAGDLDLSVVVGRYLDTVARLSSVRILRVGCYGR